MTHLSKNLCSTVLCLWSALALTACETTANLYSGPQRQSSEIATIRGVSVVEGQGHNPNILMNAWKLNGAAPTSDHTGPYVWAVLPGKQEVGVTLALVSLVPMSVSRFEGTYWVPFDAEAGHVYQFYAESDHGKAPLKVCALKVPKEIWPVSPAEGAKLPKGVSIAGCGTPKSPVDTYGLRACNGVGSCPISDDYIKP